MAIQATSNPAVNLPVSAGRTPAPPAPPKARQSAPQPASAVPTSSPIPQDTVSISKAAQAALQEATETQAQTAKEAQSGDRQAIKLLAKEVSTTKL